MSSREISNRRQQDLSSLFLAVSDILSTDQANLRQNFCNYIESNQSKYEKTKKEPLQTYLESVKNNLAPLSEFEIEILSEVIGRQIFLSRDSAQDKNASEEDIILFWDNRNSMFRRDAGDDQGQEGRRPRWNRGTGKSYPRGTGNRNGFDPSMRDPHFRKEGGRGRGKRDFEPRDSEPKFSIEESNFPSLPIQGAKKDPAQMMEELNINDNEPVQRTRSSAWAQPRSWRQQPHLKQKDELFDQQKFESQEDKEAQNNEASGQEESTPRESGKFNTQQRHMSSGIKSSPKNYRQQERKTGKVKFFNLKQGYGFVVPDEEGPDVFVHYTAIALSETGNKTLSEGETVEYYLTEGPKGLQAAHITGPQNTPVKGSANYYGHENPEYMPYMLPSPYTHLYYQMEPPYPYPYPPYPYGHARPYFPPPMNAPPPAGGRGGYYYPPHEQHYQTFDRNRDGETH